MIVRRGYGFGKVPPMSVRVPMEKFGRDHWSLLAYVNTTHALRAQVSPSRMRTDRSLHPALVAPDMSDAQKYPTRLKGNEIVENHDDWSCLDDLEAAGLIVNRGSGLHRSYGLTPAGADAARQLLAHKAKGLLYATFSYKHHAIVAPKVGLR